MSLQYIHAAGIIHRVSPGGGASAAVWMFQDPHFQELLLPCRGHHGVQWDLHTVCMHSPGGPGTSTLPGGCRGRCSPLPGLLSLPPAGGATQLAFLCPQDLKPGNLAVNEDCELKVCVGGRAGGSLPTCPSASGCPGPQTWWRAGPGPGRRISLLGVAEQLMATGSLGRHLTGVALGTLTPIPP